MDLFDLTPLLAIPALQKVLDAYRQLVLEADFRKFAFTVGAWVLGVGLVVLISESSAAIDLPPWNWADKVLVGIGLGSAASVVHDLTKKKDTVTIGTASSVEIEGSEPEPVG